MPLKAGSKKRGQIDLSAGWGAGIRTPIGRSRVGSPTIERHPIVCSDLSEISLRAMYITVPVARCQAVFGLFGFLFLIREARSASGAQPREQFYGSTKKPWGFLQICLQA